MDGESVTTDEPSEQRTPQTLTEIFREAFPYYLAMGMTYDEFWNGELSLVRDYRKARDIRLHEEESARHRQGAYIYDALLAVAPVFRMSMSGGAVKPGEYPDRPYPITEEEARKREEERELANFNAYLAQMERESAAEMKRREASQKKEANKDG